jgi:molybdopterin molybdotransferase
MISVAEALKLIDDRVPLSAVGNYPLEECLGCVLAEDVHSPIDMPSFRQSSMDGYAIVHAALESYTLVGEVQAGIASNVALGTGEAVRIFTGARVPDNADTVVMQEHTRREGDLLFVDKLPNPGSNVRARGEQLVKGALALPKGTVLTEGALGLLAGIGMDRVPCRKTPKVSIIITGNELVAPGLALKEGQVYESSSFALKSALKRRGIQDIVIHYVKDDLDSTRAAIAKQLNDADLVLISGGISVGDYDFARQALIDNGVQEHFYKVNQKPGKPLWFGTHNETVVFALPGNPASSLTCLYVYVLAAIRRMMGHRDLRDVQQHAISQDTIMNTHAKQLFLKGMVRDGRAEVLVGQASFIMRSFALCNALLIVPADTEQIAAGAEIEYIDLSSGLG